MLRLRVAVPVARRDGVMELVPLALVVVLVPVVRYLVGDLLADGNRGLLLLAPAGGDMVDGVAAAAEEEQGPVRAAEQADALGVAKHGKA